MPLALPLLALLILPRTAPRKIAVVVGVSGYLVPQEKGKGGFESLSYAHRDAERMAGKLSGLGWETTLLQGFPGAKASRATKAGVLGALSGLKTGRDDTVLLYFSGHGVRLDGTDYLVPADGAFLNEEKDPELKPKWRPDARTLISREELSAAFAKMPAAKRMMILDACRSVPQIEKDGDAPAMRLNQAKLGESVQVSEFGPTSVAVMFSCKPGEKSYEDARAEGGVYTGAWLSALDSGRVTNADGDVNLEELNRETRRRVGDWIRANAERPMSPNMTTDMEDPIVLGTLKVQSGGGAVLLPTRARLVVTSDAKEAMMTVDGASVAGLSVQIEVPAGGTKQATVVVSAPGRESETYRVMLEAGRQTTIAAELPVRATESPSPPTGGGSRTTSFRAPVVGEERRYHSQGRMTVTETEMTLDMHLTERVIELGSQGGWTIEQTTTKGTVSFGGQDMDVPQADPTRTVFRADGTVETVAGKTVDGFSYRGANLGAIPHPERSVGVGDSWRKSAPSDAKTGAVAYTAQFRIEGEETIGSWRVYRVAFSVVETEGSEPASYSGTYWLAQDDLSVVKGEFDVKNMPVSGVSGVGGKMTITRE